MFLRVIILALYFIPTVIFAQVQINEIMYDLEGADADHEWVELYNSGSADIDLTEWKFNDGSNHLLNAPPKNGSRGFLAISAGEYIILSGKAEVFIIDHPEYSGTVIDTVMSLNNTEDTLSLLDENGSTIDSVSYTKDFGANGDGNSLQLVNVSFIAGTPTLGLVNINNNENINSNDETQQEVQETTPSYGGAYAPPEPQISVAIIINEVAIVGASTIFDAQAYGFEDEPIDNARYVWNFGDGTKKEGKSIFHIYNYPGEYVVNVDVSSGKYSALKRKIINVVNSDIAISSANRDFIELYNKSEYELDLSLWILGVNGKFFTLPKNTFILAGKKIIFPSTTTNLFANNLNEVKLYYPNGNIVVIDNNSVQTQITKNTTQPQTSNVIHQEVQTDIIITQENENLSLSAQTSAQVEEIKNEINIAAPIYTQESQNGRGLYKWILALISIMGIAILVVVFSRDKNKTKTGEITAEDIKIIK